MSNATEPQYHDASKGEKVMAQVRETEVLTTAERDEQALARLGKKPVLKVCLNLRDGSMRRCQS